MVWVSLAAAGAILLLWIWRVEETGMAIVKLTQTTLEIPHEAGHSMTFQQLGWRALEEARQVRTQIVMGNMRAMGGEIYDIIRSQTRTAADEVTPINNYDKGTLLRNGIVAWTYEQKLTAESIDALDEETSEWALNQIATLAGVADSKDAADPKS